MTPTWQAILSRDAWRLWVWLQATLFSAMTLPELARAIRASKTRTKTAIMELEDNGFLSIEEDTS